MSLIEFDRVTKELRALFVAERAASKAEYVRGYDEGVAAGYDLKLDALDDGLSNLIEELVHKRDVLGVDIGDPLEVLQQAIREGVMRSG